MNVIEIPLTRGFATVIDHGDGDIVLTHRWHAVVSRSGIAYAARAVSTGLRRPRQRSLYLHTFLTGYPRTDHVDGDGLNNQRENLRPASTEQNNRNRLSHPGSSQFKGVSLNRGRGLQWKAGIKVDGVSRHLGYHASEEMAARAYDDAARRLFGVFATFNFPRAGERSALAATP